MTQGSLEINKDDKVYVKPPTEGKAEIYKVPSKSVEGKTYDLRIMPDGELRCSCPYFVFSGKLCSHIKDFTAVHAKRKQEERVNTVNKVTSEPKEPLNPPKTEEKPKKVPSFGDDFPF